MNKDLIKKCFPYFIAVIVFLLIAITYASPILEGKVLQAGDKISAIGMGQEVMQYTEHTGEKSFWTGSMFSGMPNYQINTWIGSKVFLSNCSDALKLWLPGAIGMIFLYLIGFFILLRAFKVNPWVCIIGAIAIAFSSYFFIIIEAGHNNKVYALAYLAAIIGGFKFIFDKRYVLGVIVTMIYTAIGLLTHPQMSYYVFMLIGLFVIAELVICIKEKRILDFLIASALFVGAVAIGLGTNYSSIKANKEYIAETMRGGHSELVKESDATNKTKGLDLDYATNWSYGIPESMTLLIPNCMGGASNYAVNDNSKVYSALIQNGVPRKSADEFCQNVPTYWGEQPFTSGPVYVGAILLFLFVLGLFVVKGPYKWALLVATIFSIMLAWGKNFMPLTEFFFNYFPFYDKFRAVSSILIIAEITIPLLGILAVQEMLKGDIDKQKARKYLLISTAITGGICLIYALLGGTIFNFQGSNDEQIFTNLPEWLSSAIVSERVHMLRIDALRSLILILLTAAAIWLFLADKLKRNILIPILGVLVLVDLWPVDKRFLNNDNFVTEKKYNSYFKKQPYEEALLQDTDPNFRVLNLTTNTFNESRTSYYFKSIGGYSAAKLRRYQDLIDEHISKMNMNVLNMLNTKYVITQNPQTGEIVPQRNPEAFGNAWFIDSLVVVKTPNEECASLNDLDLRHVASVDQSFSQFVKKENLNTDSTDAIQLTSYAPNCLTYDYNAANDRTVVFSEIYYPHGWKAYIDDKPAEHFRADYTLRALNVPAGKHSIKFEFKPDSVYKGEKISYTFIALLGAISAGMIAFNIVSNRKKKTGVAK